MNAIVLVHRVLTLHCELKFNIYSIWKFTLYAFVCLWMCVIFFILFYLLMPHHPSVSLCWSLCATHQMREIQQTFIFSVPIIWNFLPLFHQSVYIQSFQAQDQNLSLVYSPANSPTYSLIVHLCTRTSFMTFRMSSYLFLHYMINYQFNYNHAQYIEIIPRNVCCVNSIIIIIMRGYVQQVCWMYLRPINMWVLKLIQKKNHLQKLLFLYF